MTLNIKLPDEAIKPLAMILAGNVTEGQWNANSSEQKRPMRDAKAAIIAALEKMVEIGMARSGVMESGGWRWRNICATKYPATHSIHENVIIIRMDGGESDDHA